MFKVIFNNFDIHQEFKSSELGDMLPIGFTLYSEANRYNIINLDGRGRGSMTLQSP